MHVSHLNVGEDFVPLTPPLVVFAIDRFKMVARVLFVLCMALWLLAAGRFYVYPVYCLDILLSGSYLAL